MSALWPDDSARVWRHALARYPEVVAAQNVAGLAELDAWYQHELPSAVGGRRPPHVTHAELVRLTEWKMGRGVWRAPNLVRVRSISPEDVKAASTEALAAAPDPRRPIATLSALDGVGPATASALMAAARPEVYPFLDELVAAQVPALGKVAWTLGYYLKYAAALRERAAALGGELHVESGPGAGTTITLAVPASGPAPKRAA